MLIDYLDREGPIVILPPETDATLADPGVSGKRAGRLGENTPPFASELNMGKLTAER
jgi:hypothetical protein